MYTCIYVYVYIYMYIVTPHNHYPRPGTCVKETGKLVREHRGEGWAGEWRAGRANASVINMITHVYT